LLAASAYLRQGAKISRSTESGLRDLNGAIRAAAVEGELIRAPGCFLIASCGFVQFECF
jgi:hypothetical protein